MPMEASLLERGDGFTHVSAGGGGFGDPFERDPAAVLEDVLDEKVSFAAARERYGVVIADGARRRRRDAGSEGLPMIELAIRNGLVVDGTGAEPRPADVGIEDGRIVLVGEVPEAEREIDAAGKVVAPGFIDIHSHSDFTLLVDPRAASAVHQGVTTEVVGNCGFGCFPLLEQGARAEGDLRALGRGAAHAGRRPPSISSGSRRRAPAINVASLAPNGQIRLSVVGLADRPRPAGRARADALPARRGAGAGRLRATRPASSTQPSAAPTRTSSSHVQGLRPAPRPLRDAHATA